MGTRLLVIALVACGGAPPAPPPAAPTAPAPRAAEDAVRIAYKVPSVGMASVEERRTVMAMTLRTPDGKTHDMSRTVHERRRIEVLATDARRVTRARYTFEVNSKRDTNGAGVTTRPTLIAGKTYTLELGTPTVPRERLIVSTESGPAPPDEADEVRAEVKRFGKPDDISRLVANRTYRKDAVVELPVAEVPDALDDGTLTRLALTYRRTDGDVAIFDIVMAMSGTRDGLTVESLLTGEIAIDPRSGDVLTFAGKGPMTFSGAVQGEGTIGYSWSLYR
jgi:hypothetical protein